LTNYADVFHGSNKEFVSNMEVGEKMRLRHKTGRLATAALVLAISSGIASPASAATWTGTSLTPVDPSRTAVTTWNGVVGGAVSATAVRCIKLTISAEGAGVTTGFAFNSGSTSALTGALLNGGTFASTTVTATSATFTSAGAVGLVAGGFAVSNVQNPSTADEYFLKVETFTNVNCIAGLTDDTTLGFVVTSNVLVSTHVDPTLVFTVTGLNASCNGQVVAGVNLVDNTASSTAVSLGNINAAVAGAGSQNLSVTTNAAGGASVYVRSLFATTNLRNAAWSFADSGAVPPAPGVEGFGYTAANANPALGSNVFKTLTNVNARVAYSAAGNVAATCIGFQASASAGTPAGDYTATVIYTAVPVF